ncbi:MAG: FliO/MopB family protein [Bradymonadaceae bacterium]
MHWGFKPEPNRRAIPRIAAAALFLVATVAAPPTAHGQHDGSPPADTLDWRDSLDDAPQTTPHTKTEPTTPANLDTDGTPDSVDPPTTGTDLGGRLLQMLLVLAGVCALAYAVMRWGIRSLVGAGPGTDGPIEVLARRRIGTDRAILVVRVGPRALVLGDADDGLTHLDSLEDDTLDDFLTQCDTDDNSTTDSPFSSLWRLGADASEHEVSE